jgi:pilus assembly protein Flp/PilA
MFVKFLADESGATAIEYGLIAAVSASPSSPASNKPGATLNASFTTINPSLK